MAVNENLERKHLLRREIRDAIALRVELLLVELGIPRREERT
jgi:hypothetical protein